MRENPKTKRQLTRFVREEIEKVDGDLPLLKSVIVNFDKRIDLCIEKEGGNFADLL